MTNRNSDLTSNVIVLRSVYGKVGIKYFIQPCVNPDTLRYPSCVRQVDYHGDMILSDEDRNSGNFFVKVTDTFTIEDGTTFNLSDPLLKAHWEAIQYCPLIASERAAKDKNGDYLIDGTVNPKSSKPRYGIAELYIDRPGLEAQNRVKRKKKIRNALTFIFDDERGYEGHLLMARLLGKDMKNLPDADVEDYLVSVAEKDPDKIIRLYTGDDIRLRILFMDAKDKHVILYKNKVYCYGDSIVLGATDEAVITWMQQAKNQRVLELIRKEVYPEHYEDSELDDIEEMKKEIKAQSSKKK